MPTNCEFAMHRLAAIVNGNYTDWTQRRPLHALTVAAVNDPWSMTHICVIDADRKLYYTSTVLTTKADTLIDLSLIPAQAQWDASKPNSPIVFPNSGADIGPVSHVACAYAKTARCVHILALDANGKLWHMMRVNMFEIPSVFGDVQAQITNQNIGPIADVACATDHKDNLLVLAVDLAGEIWQTTRATSGSWTDFSPFSAPPGQATRIACSFDNAGNLHVAMCGAYEPPATG